MKKEEAIKIITKAAKEFQNNLAHNNILFITGHPDAPNCVEAVFFPRNFLHLTGIKLNGGNNKKSVTFYNECLNGKLKPNEFYMASNGTTEMKLNVILTLMNIHKTARMMGDYNSSKSVLYTEKLTGNHIGCMGFANYGGYYNPNTLLNEDIRSVTQKPQDKVLAILRKPIKQEKYTELCYAAKGIQLDKIKLPIDYSEKIDIPKFNQENIHQQNQQLSQNLCSKSQDQNKAAQPFI